MAVPINVLATGQSPQIKIPKAVAQISDEYENGATTLAGAAVKALIKNKCPAQPNTPLATNNNQPNASGMLQCQGNNALVTTAPATAVNNNDVNGFSPRNLRVKI